MTFLVPFATQHPIHTSSRPRWAHGQPINLLLHFTGGVGMQFPGGERFASEGIGSPFGIHRDGELLQYMIDIDEASTWHAFSESMYGIGIEVEAGPPANPVTDAQIETLIKWGAACAKRFDIPVVRDPGVSYGWGFKCHTDGLENYKVWNLHHHYDSPLQVTGDPTENWVSSLTVKWLNTSPCSWKDYLIEVKKTMAPPPPPPPRYPGVLMRYTPPSYRRGDDVLRYKQRLAALGWNKIHLMAKDDVYGNATYLNTKEFQAKHNLASDGIVGEKTWNAIFNIT